MDVGWGKPMVAWEEGVERVGAKPDQSMTVEDQGNML